MDEVEFDAIDGLEADDVVVHEPVEFLRVLIGKENELAGAEVVAAGVLGRCRFSFGGDRPVGLSAVIPGCLILLVGTHSLSTASTVASGRQDDGASLGRAAL